MVALRVVLVTMFLGCVLGQVLVPTPAEEQGGRYRETAHLAIPYSVIAILSIARLQAALVIIWRLLSMVEQDSVFSNRAVRRVSALTTRLPLAAFLAALAPIHLLFVVKVGGPGIVLSLAAVRAIGWGMLLLMLVMRGLLIAATRDRNELDMVV
ncbi:DUF2975 domain-containing protein [Glutamicibacter sp. MNS18]|uniref:DUF2975 domain-containing protein n=1 Tax=Glutamicibacter sp. MNS18 TaxID=2989817 RepID=UPI002235ED6B|nr:DUF2975 domain-containing protein [Glutamicibacter sp. MNS18]MCW4465371.1 DUF2975 domain-containing protein [Glutamicibacter sp. MNS18]